MRLCFLSPFSKETDSYYQSICHGIGIMASIAGKNCDVDIYPFTDIDELNGVNNTDYVLISSYSNQLGIVKKAIKALSQRGIKCIVGGVHATFAPQDFIDTDYYILVRGDGEEFIRSLIVSEKKALSLPGVFKKGDVIKDTFAPIVEDLDTLPFTKRYVKTSKKVASIMGFEVMTGRGCWYACTYCSTPAFKRIYKNYNRRRSPENVIKEIKENSDEYPIIGFHDDHFLSDIGWLDEFLPLYKKNINKPFWCNSRVESIDDGFIKKLKDAGLTRIHMGVECAGYERRKYLLNRDITDEMIINAFSICKKNRIKTLSFNMIGLPDDDEKKILELIDLNKILAPDWMHVSIFQPYPGVKLYEYCEERGIKIPFTKDYYTFETGDYLEGISGKRLKYYVDNFVKLVKMR